MVAYELNQNRFKGYSFSMEITLEGKEGPIDYTFPDTREFIAMFDRKSKREYLHQIFKT